MKKKWLIVSISVLGILGVLYLGVRHLFYKIPDVCSSPSPENSSYFVTIPITSWTQDKIPTPCISIQIENHTITSSLDLGFKGFFSLEKQLLNQIDNKICIGSQKRYGLRGKEYTKHVFEVPEIRMGNLTLSRVPVQEEAEAFHMNACMSKDTEQLLPNESGRMGWETCRLAGNLLIDLANGTIAFCDSLSTLEAHGYDVKAYTRVPLLTDRGLIEFTAETEMGALRCVLDSGCTLNCVNTPLPKGQSINNFQFDPLNSLTLQQFQISEYSFGPLIFYKFPLELPIQVDAILGMDFFMNHLIFLNFTERLIYIEKNKP